MMSIMMNAAANDDRKPATPTGAGAGTRPTTPVGSSSSAPTPAAKSNDGTAPVFSADSSAPRADAPKDRPAGNDNTPTGAVRPTIIAEGTKISGDVEFGSNAEVYGVLHANVQSESDIITNSGQIIGDVHAKNMDMINAEVRGDVTTAGDFRVNDKSEMQGNVEARRMDLRGKLTGDSNVANELNVHSSAIVGGDIEAGSIAIGHGAKIKGFINAGSGDA